MPPCRATEARSRELKKGKREAARKETPFSKTLHAAAFEEGRDSTRPLVQELRSQIRELVKERTKAVARCQEADKRHVIDMATRLV